MTVVQGDENEWKKIKHIRERVCHNTPLSAVWTNDLQLGDQDDIASALYALCTNRYMNGTVLYVDGGWLVDNP
jgi:NAD(P)-dependent dehydrogenase (short-subunit alcohol dehydrogenase family)